MRYPPEHSKSLFDRRHFISNSIKITLLAGILSPFGQACNTKSKGSTKKDSKDRSTSKNNSKRKKWHAENLLINTKTNVVHLPTAAFYNYYDEIKNTKTVMIDDWENQLREPVRLNKDRSGNILEILSLQKLRNGITDNSLNSAINTLAIAFSRDCENSNGTNYNTTNYRLHELMLQLIALNNSMPYKWNTFNDSVRKPQKIGKRQSWMADENGFSQRVNYIRDREADYKTRLINRASKYALT
jgi:hypothetical protein